ncbi:PREDICTED: peptidyl-prolyl cis-trans isomerase cyp6-like [Eufriesea mexicana]|uniref:peptidyl-prolyl cis-trans isomerase cyp6-like n=1 Tax=Eufriesea mexicana TaxID=516756 RepID=UPI00083C577E|nr:PREDICTED: peptidyl-prolyl cis-trans isomerase cyp6-like [Eufriesea mexicana]
MDKKTYRKYKKRIAQAVAKVDNKAPKFEIPIYYKMCDIINDITRIRQLDRENMELIRRMNIITRLGGNIDCWLPKIKYTSRLENQKIKNGMIMKQNIQLLQKIRSADSNYSAAEFVQNWKKMKKKTQHRKRNTPFHRIVSGYWCQGGDVTKFNGSGGISIYGESFENENYNLRHAGPGILSMCNENENTSNSKFNLTFRRLETVDKKNVVFGKVISGLSNIYKIEEFGTKTGKPFKTIIISNCGIISRHVERIQKKLSKI